MVRSKRKKPVGFDSPYERRQRARADRYASCLRTARRMWLSSMACLVLVMILLLACILSLVSCRTHRDTARTDSTQLLALSQVSSARTHHTGDMLFFSNLPPNLFVGMAKSVCSRTASAGSPRRLQQNATTPPSDTLTWFAVTYSGETGTATADAAAASRAVSASSRHTARVPGSLPRWPFYFAAGVAASCTILWYRHRHL